MKLLPMDAPGMLELAAGWLAQKENYQWLDFGTGRQLITPALLKIMVQRPSHFMRIYTSDEDVPIGIVGLNNVDRTFKSAVFWGAAGDKSFRNRGYGTRAGAMFLTLSFRDLGLHAINTWVVDGNVSLKIIERLRFRFIGRLRQCHYIDGRPHDRLIFDLLASEHKELEYDRSQRTARANRETVSREHERTRAKG